MCDVFLTPTVLSTLTNILERNLKDFTPLWMFTDTHFDHGGWMRNKVMFELTHDNQATDISYLKVLLFSRLT